MSIEFAVLIGTRTGLSPRYPPMAVVRSFAAFARTTGLRSAIHLCGRASRAVAAGETGELAEICRQFGRVQVNGTVPLDKLVRFREQIRRPVIAQWREETFPTGTGLEYLHDRSGGEGRQNFEAWPPAPRGERVGYAGGIGPTTVREAVRLGRKLGGTWIDMESRVRTAADRLDTRRVRKVIREAAAELRRRPAERARSSRAGHPA